MDGTYRNVYGLVSPHMSNIRQPRGVRYILRSTGPIKTFMVWWMSNIFNISSPRMSVLATKNEVFWRWRIYTASFSRKDGWWLWVSSNVLSEKKGVKVLNLDRVPIPRCVCISEMVRQRCDREMKRGEIDSKKNGICGNACGSEDEHLGLESQIEITTRYWWLPNTSILLKPNSKDDSRWDWDSSSQHSLEKKSDHALNPNSYHCLVPTRLGWSRREVGCETMRSTIRSTMSSAMVTRVFLSWRYVKYAHSFSGSTLVSIGGWIQALERGQTSNRFRIYKIWDAYRFVLCAEVLNGQMKDEDMWSQGSACASSCAYTRWCDRIEVEDVCNRVVSWYITLGSGYQAVLKDDFSEPFVILQILKAPPALFPGITFERCQGYIYHQDLTLSSMTWVGWLSEQVNQISNSRGFCAMDWVRSRSSRLPLVTGWPNLTEDERMQWLRSNRRGCDRLDRSSECIHASLKLCRYSTPSMKSGWWSGSSWRACWRLDSREQRSQCLTPWKDEETGDEFESKADMNEWESKRWLQGAWSRPWQSCLRLRRACIDSFEW